MPADSAARLGGNQPAQMANLMKRGERLDATKHFMDWSRLHANAPCRLSSADCPGAGSPNRSEVIERGAMQRRTASSINEGGISLGRSIDGGWTFSNFIWLYLQEQLDRGRPISTAMTLQDFPSTSRFLSMSEASSLDHVEREPGGLIIRFGFLAAARSRLNVARMYSVRQPNRSAISAFVMSGY